MLPDAFSPEVQQEILKVQWERMVRQMPIFNILNMIFTLAVLHACYVGSMPLRDLILPCVLFLVLAHRTLVWRTRRAIPHNSATLPLIIKRSTWWITTMTAGASIWNVFAFYEVPVLGQTVIPVFITLSALIAANCLASLPRAAGQALAVGILPSVALYVGSGELVLITLAIGLVFAGLLQLQLVTESHRQWMNTLRLGQQLREIANTDSLTGLCNRRAFSEKFKAAFENAEAGSSFAIAILDLDDFKPVNDRHGHFAGDRLLQIVGTRLRQHVVKTDMVSRLGGDEFAVLFRNIADEADLSARATAILASFSALADIGEALVPIPASLGYAMFPRDGDSPHALMLAADRAMYRAKADGKSRAAEFPELRITAQNTAEPLNQPSNRATR
jgi:diguanylate cyclase